VAYSGWIRLHRKILDNPIWPSGRAYTKLEAFLDILLRVNYEPGKAKFGGAAFDVKRGELITSEVKLAERWQWSRGKVRRFLDELKMEQICEKNGTANYTAISLVKYDFLQGDDTSNDTSDGTLNSTSNSTQLNNIKNKKNTSCPKLKFSDDHLNLAKLFRFLITERKPDYKFGSSVESWANEIRLTEERDNRPLVRIRALIEWTQQDSFWQNNCLSPGTLRKQFDRLEMTIKSNVVPFTKQRKAVGEELPLA